MEKIPKMVDMQVTPTDCDMPVASNIKLTPNYPYGLGLCLNDPELKKLGLDEEECEVGDHVHFHCLAKVTSVRDDEACGKRIELQIVAMSAEDEDSENEESEEEMDRLPPAKLNPDKMYK